MSNPKNSNVRTTPLSAQEIEDLKNVFELEISDSQLDAITGGVSQLSDLTFDTAPFLTDPGFVAN